MKKIPKIIHFCWFGGKDIPEEYKRYIESWKKYMPDYEIKMWTEDNYDVYKNDFIARAYKEKKWAFVSDYARLDIVYNNGGIYLDTDVEVIKTFDPLLKNDAFMGREDGGYVATGLGFGAKPGCQFIKKNLEYYDNLGKDFLFADNTCPIVTTRLLDQECNKKDEKRVTQISGVTIYPSEYFAPLGYRSGKMHITKNTFSIHHYSMNWLSPVQKKRILFERKIQGFAGPKISAFIAKLAYAFPRAIEKRIEAREKNSKG